MPVTAEKCDTKIREDSCPGLAVKIIQRDTTVFQVFGYVDQLTPRTFQSRNDKRIILSQ